MLRKARPQAPADPIPVGNLPTDYSDVWATYLAMCDVAAQRAAWEERNGMRLWGDEPVSQAEYVRRIRAQFRPGGF